jgi:hypothetical protein
MYRLKKHDEELTKLFDYHQIPLADEGCLIIMRVPGGYLHTTTVSAPKELSSTVTQSIFIKDI